MAENKKSFVAYAEWLESFEMLEDEEAGKLIKHLLRYVNDLKPELSDRLLKIAFQPIKQQLKRDLNKYEEVSKKRAEAGRKGGIKTQKKAKQAIAKGVKQIQPNQADNDNDNDNDNEDDNVNEKRERKENYRALDFLKNNFPERFQTDFQMKYASHIENKKKFAEDFNDTVDSEKRDYDDALFGRLGKYARNWIENQEKFKPKKEDTYSTSNIPIG